MVFRALGAREDTNMRLMPKNDLQEDLGTYATKAISAREHGYRQLWGLDLLGQERFGWVSGAPIA